MNCSSWNAWTCQRRLTAKAFAKYVVIDQEQKQSFCHTYPLQKPALRVHWLVPKQPNSSRNRAQHAFPAQRPESLTLRTDTLKKQSFCHTYPLQKPALRVHWLVPKQPNSSRNRAQHAFPAPRPESLTLRADALKKQSFCHTYALQKPALNSSRIRAQHAFPAQRPESLTSRTDALKKQSFCHTYLLQKPALRVHWLVPKQPKSSRNRAQHAFPAQRPESLTSHTDALKKTKLMPHLTSFESPLAGSETAEQQQESCPTCLPSTAPRISDVAYWRPKKTKLLPHLPIAETSFESPLAGCETAEQQQESCPTCLPSTAPRISNVAYWRPKKTKLMPHLPIAKNHLWESIELAGSETAEQQQESCPTCLPSTAPQISNVAYWRPKKTKLLPHLPIAETSFESPLAGCETAEQQQESCPTCLPSTAPRISNVAYWRPKKTKLMPHLPIAKTSFESPLAGSETAEQQQESCPTCLPSTAPRISNVAYWRPKKTKLLPHLPIAETSFESPLAGSETAEQQQESCPTCLPSTAPRISNVAYWHPKKTKLMPHLPIAETSFESPLAGCETAEQQQESCPTCLPSTAPRISNVACWHPQKTKLLPHLPIAETSFDSPWAGSETAEQQQDSCPTCLPSTAPRISNVAYWRPKKTKLMPHLPIAKTSFESPLAGSETAEQQQESCPTCLPSTAPRISNVAYWRPKKTKLLPHLPIAKTSFESPLAGSETAEQQQESCPTCLPSTAPRICNVAYWRPKKTKLLPHLPIAETSFESPLAGCETAERQQESCPTCLPSTAPRISNVAYWRPKKTKLMPHLPIAKTSFESPWAGSETAEQQQESCPTCLPSTAPRISNVAYWRPKETKLMPHLPIAETSFESPLAGSETAEQQQESCPACLPSTAPRISNVAYWHPKKTKLLPHLPIAETSFESPLAGWESCPTCLPSTAPRISNVALTPSKNKASATPTHCRNQLWQSIGWFRNGRTAAGFVPNMPSQHSAPNL